MIDPLTLDQMRVLVAIAETGSFLRRRAPARPRAVGDQPGRQRDGDDAAAVPVRSLDARPRHLTEAGAAIVEDARAIVDSAKAMRARARKASPRTSSRN